MGDICPAAIWDQFIPSPFLSQCDAQAVVVERRSCLHVNSRDVIDCMSPQAAISIVVDITILSLIRT